MGYPLPRWTYFLKSAARVAMVLKPINLRTFRLQICSLLSWSTHRLLFPLIQRLDKQAWQELSFKTFSSLRLSLVLDWLQATWNLLEHQVLIFTWELWRTISLQHFSPPICSQTFEVFLISSHSSLLTSSVPILVIGLALQESLLIKHPLERLSIDYHTLVLSH